VWGALMGRLQARSDVEPRQGTPHRATTRPRKPPWPVALSGHCDAITYCRAILFAIDRRNTMSAVAENIQTEMPAPIVFTDSAAAKVADLIAEEGNPDLKLRVFVQGGGCSGFQYGFTFDEIVNEDDTTMTKNGVSLLIDAMSYQYLIGAEIDYKEDLQGAQFVIKNPNATTTCGCGSSFSV
jgi:iron-sulfur cluster insertion protein